MKKLIFLFPVVYCLLSAVCSYSQVKVVKATVQKTFGGMGGTFMNYTIGFTNRSSDSIRIDSVKTIADTSPVSIYYNKTEKAYCEFAYSYALSQPSKCATCPDRSAKQANMTKGVVVYYKRGNKKGNFKTKKFKQLPELMMP